MATLVDQDFRARLQALADKFAAGVPATTQSISAILSHCGNEIPAPDALEKLHALLHGVAGSAGTFGLATLGREARVLEQEVRLLQEKRADWPALAARIAAFVDWAERDPKSSTYPA